MHLGRSSDYFQITNGVRQGGVLSLILFTIYLDSLLECLQASGAIGSTTLCYADDLIIWQMLSGVNLVDYVSMLLTLMICFQQTTCPSCPMPILV